EAQFVFEDSLSSSGAIVNHPARNSITVKTISVDQIIDWSTQTEPYLIKVDVEGLEVEVLKGSQRAMEARALIMCEVFHDSFHALLEIAGDRSYEILDWAACRITKNEVFRRADFVMVPKENYEQVRQRLQQP